MNAISEFKKLILSLIILNFGFLTLSAQENSAISLQKRLITLMAKMNIINNSDDFDTIEGDSLFNAYLDRVQTILNDHRSNQIDFNTVMDSCDRFSVHNSYEGKVKIYSWNAYWNGVFQSDVIHFISIADSTSRSLRKVHNDQWITNIDELSDDCMLIETLGRSHRNCYYTSFFLAPINKKGIIFNEAPNISFSYSYMMGDEFINYDAKAKNIRYANRPCYFWNEVDEGEEYPLNKGEILINTEECKAIYSE